MKEFKLKEEFVLGTSVDSVMVEGGNTKTNWYDWSEKGRIKDGSHIIRGSDHWNKYLEDIAIMKELNIEAHNFTIEWSRVEPENGMFDTDAMDHYRDEIKNMIANNVKPMLTLHQFSDPMWLEELGGWSNTKAVEYFQRFVEFVVNTVGDLVCDWVPIADANIVVFAGYLLGWHPPGKKGDVIGMFKAMKNMVTAHINSYRQIHHIREKKGFIGRTNVGVAVHVRVYESLTKKVLDKLTTKWTQYIAQNLVLNSMVTGKFTFPIGWNGYPMGKGCFCDFIGLNVFSRNMVNFTIDPSLFFLQLSTKKDTWLTDRGWEVYPEGIYILGKEYYRKYNIPIYITGSGLLEYEDNKRGKLICECLHRVNMLIEEGIPVERYYVWTLVDICECHEGERARCGIVHNDFETHKRTIKKSGRLYAEICSKKALTKEMIDRYELV